MRCPIRRMERRCVTRALGKLLGGVIFAGLAVIVLGQTLSQAQETIPAVAQAELVQVRTDSPRETLATFLRLKDEMEAALVTYAGYNSLEIAERLSLLSDQMVALIELNQVPAVARRDAGIETAPYLMDIFGHLPPLDLASVPNEAAL